MLKKRNAQGLSVTTIVVAIIGLTVLIVLVAIFTGRMGLFSGGLDDSKTCEGLCTAQNLDTIGYTEAQCKNPVNNARYMPGDYVDVATGFVCCCVTPP